MEPARRRWLVIGLALPSLALASAPLTSGMIAKSAFVASEAIVPEQWAGMMRFLLPLTSVATALLMARFLVLVSRSPDRAERHIGKGPWLIWCASLVMVLLLPLWLTPAAGFSWTMPIVIESLWPLGVALVIALIAIRAWRHAGRPSIPEIPAGDVLMPMERLSLNVRGGVFAIIGLARSTRDRIRRATDAGRGRAWALVQSTSRSEALLNRWRVALILALLLGIALALLAGR